LRQSANLGFAAGNNVALRRATDADQVLLFNNDALFPETDSLAKAVAYLESDPSISGVCGRFEYPDGKFQLFYNRLPTAWALICQYGCGRRLKMLRESKTVSRFLMHDVDFERPQTIEQPAFACVLMRGASCRKTGLLDEAFPIFFNDVDYCWRWRNQGFTWQYLPEWRIVHHHGRSVKRLSGMLRAEMLGSLSRFARKHFGLPASLLVRSAVGFEAAFYNMRNRDHEYSAWDMVRGRHFFARHP
jgi:GT2 family glycosyltransferase